MLDAGPLKASCREIEAVGAKIATVADAHDCGDREGAPENRSWENGSRLAQPKEARAHPCKGR
jgi:hypothetical protein